ncbi:RelA/SpoT domain-containing protein [Mycobacterium sp. 852014-50255_SCH5639931]|uniref:RelA/SpoT domain-containing protein n=1 Tax=Mycobacterium sp. 852014-50255_SCH5639931 TaxID=1834112 RepID=UPI0009EEAB6D|nr:RelA/SpoT domain-containing protein [Mycobacterium sp. 852014-50255_SCH5639931]
MAITNKAKEARIERILAEYDSKFGTIELFRTQLLAALENSSELAPLVHSFKSRPKDREHLRDKLRRKMDKDGPNFDVDPENLLVKINDLAGVRILHLHTRQIAAIDPVLKTIFEEQKYDLLEGPFARTWDDESREFFETCGIEAQKSPTMYTSVHYVVGSASRTTVTCEVQVRTLMEEVWGEVDHTLNYPVPTSVRACQEELKVLARVTSSATRLVDAIFAAAKEK